MNKFVKTLCIGLSLVTIVSAFAGCSKNSNKNNSNNDSFVDVSDDETSTTELLADTYLDIKINNRTVDYTNMTLEKFCDETGYKAIGDKDEDDNYDEDFDINSKVYGVKNTYVVNGDSMLYLEVVNQDNSAQPLKKCYLSSISDVGENNKKGNYENPISNGLSINGVKVGDKYTVDELIKKVHLNVSNESNLSSGTVVFYKPGTENYDVSDHIYMYVRDGIVDEIVI